MYNQHVGHSGPGLLPVTREPSQELALWSLAVGVCGGCRWVLGPWWVSIPVNLVPWKGLEAQGTWKTSVLDFR